MRGEQYLLLPGPTPIPDRVVRAMARPLINHRGPEFKALFLEIVDEVKKVYQTSGNLLIYPSSGTGGLEAAISNFVSPGDKVLVVSIGVFGDRLAEISKAFGAKVEKMDFTWGTSADPQKIKERLDQDVNHEIKAILVTHNETSTGAYNNIKAISAARGNHPALMIVDAVSSLVALEVRMDEWGIDVIVSGSQKAFMVPPGLSFMAFNDRALEVYRRNTNAHYYWDIKTGLSYMEKGETPFTPPISLFFGLHESIKMLKEEGFDNVIARHNNYKNIVRSAVQAMGLKVLAADDCASPVVTSVIAPEGIEANKIRSYMLDKFNVVLSGGQKSLNNIVFRIGHLGYVRELDLLSALGALEITLQKFNYPLELGKGLQKAQEYIARI